MCVACDHANLQSLRLEATKTFIIYCYNNHVFHDSYYLISPGFIYVSAKWKRCEICTE